MKKLLISLSLLASSYGMSAEAPDPSKVYVKRITWAGSGCADASTVNNQISDDARAFTLSFNSFTAEIGPGVPLGDRHSKCKIKVDIQIPQGWSYTLFDADYRGEAYLEEGVSARFASKYYFQSKPK